MVQFGTDKLLVHVSERDLLIVNDWQVTQQIVEPNDSNTNKYWMKPVPGFHETEFPFVICNGWEHFNIVNIKDGYMEPLIHAATKTGLSQEAALFVDTGNSFEMHFASQIISVSGRHLQFWHCMNFREDFIQTLKKFGRLPISSTKGQLKKIKYLEEELEKKDAEHAKQIRDLEQQLEFYKQKALKAEKLQQSIARTIQ